MNVKRVYLKLLSFIVINLQFADGQISSYNRPLIFPIPYEIQVDQENFEIDNSTFIVLPQKASQTDTFLANLLFSEFSDKYELPVLLTRRSEVSDNDKIILIGDLSNPLVKQYCEKKGIVKTLTALGNEGYILSVTGKQVIVASVSKTGALYGLESLRQVISRKNGQLIIPCLRVRDKPNYPFRGIKLYLPGRDNVTFFKRFIRDFAALYKFNTIILELNANMRLERHPELNVGAVQFARYLNFSRLDRPPGVHNEYQNSSHQDNADGGILEKAEVAEIVNYIRQFNIEVIPELPSLTHAYYLLWGHKDLAENMVQPFPDTYCPLKPGSYKIYFDVLDEYIDVIHPSIIHVGHDEWRMEKDLCELCRGKDYGDLYAADLAKIHDYLAKKGIKTAIWGDHLLESVTHTEFQLWKSSSGYQYKIPGALSPEQVLKSIPKDILVFNWFWDEPANDRQISDFGFQQVYGNLRADITNWEERSGTKGLLGGAPSSWAATTEKNFGKDQLIDFLGCSNLLWSGKYLPVEKLAFIVEPLIRSIHYSFTGNLLPSDAGSKVTALDISTFYNSSVSEGIDSLLANNLMSGDIKQGNKIFIICPPDSVGKRAVVAATQKVQTEPASVHGIVVNSDVNSLLFLHASAKEAANRKAYSTIFNFDETADLLGWYEVVYEDGFIETIPLRYGLNILDWRWYQRIKGSETAKVKYNQNCYAYDADAVTCSKEITNPVTFFSYEWVNPRFGKLIKEVNLKSVNYSRNNENAIILLGISITENLKVEQVQGAERQ